jgi:hypothetical protein
VHATVGKIIGWIIAPAVFLCAVAAGIHYGPSPVEGDETEYYATTYAWATTGNPALTPAVVAEIRRVFPGRPATEPASALARNGSYYALHFWWVSLLATPGFLLCRAMGLDWRNCFVFLDAAMFAAAIGLAWRWYRWFGALVLAAGLLVSPLILYLNKAHGEAYSVSLAAIAALCMVNGRWLAAAVALAAIAVQVSAFSPLALVALAVWIYRHRRPSWGECAVVVLVVALLAVQPQWTLQRYHTLNVIVAEGFVYRDMATPRRIASLFVDPDVGFLFVWPLALVLIIAIRPEGLGAYWAFAGVLAAEMAFIAAQQMNYTTSAPRYSLWFIPFLLVGLIAGWRRRPVAALAWFLPAAAVAGWYLFSVTGIHPKLERKPLAELWYRYLPGVWDPEEQVFADIAMGRQIESGRDLFRKRRFPITRLPDPRIWALGNRPCTKLLVFGWAFTSSHVEPVRPLGCEGAVDAAGLLRDARSRGGSGMEDRFATAGHSSPAMDRPGALSHSGFLFQDSRGWQYINVATMKTRSCTLVYDQPRHELMQVLANGATSLPVVPGSAGQVCGVRGASVAAVGDSLSVTVPFADRGESWANGIDEDGVEMRFDAAGLEGPVTIAYPKGISRMWVLIHDKPGFENGCYFSWQPGGTTLTLMPDDGDGARAAVGRSVENSRCTVEASGAEAPRGPKSTPQTAFRITRKGNFAATKRVWARYQDARGAVSGWQEIGHWRGPEAEGPSAILRHRGDVLDVRFDYGADELGRLDKVWLLVNDALTVESGCYVLYRPGDGSLYVEGGRGALDNGRCTAAFGGPGTLRVTRKGDFRRALRVWAADQKDGGSISPWNPLGVWY